MKSMTKLCVTVFFILTYTVATALFGFFLDWYDTGNTDWRSPQVGFTGGLIIGCIALFMERLIYKRQGFIPQNDWGYLLRQIIQGTLFIGLGFLLIGLCYLPLIMPFGIIVGIINTILLKRTSLLT